MNLGLILSNKDSAPVCCCEESKALDGSCWKMSSLQIGSVSKITWRIHREFGVEPWLLCFERSRSERFRHLIWCLLGASLLKFVWAHTTGTRLAEGCCILSDITSGYRELVSVSGERDVCVSLLDLSVPTMEKQQKKDGGHKRLTTTSKQT